MESNRLEPVDGPALRTLDDPDALAAFCATALADAAAAAIRARGRFVLALSGGNSPRPMFERFADLPVDWDRVHVVQVDEREAPDGDPDRNLTMLAATVGAVLPAANLHAMPVDDPDGGPGRYAATLVDLGGEPPVIDLVHLGLGDDGHTASWPPGDPIVLEHEREVAMVAMFRGYRRMTLTPPCVNRARSRIFFVSGAAKAPALSRLLRGDPSLAASAVVPDATWVLADRAAAGSDDRD